MMIIDCISDLHGFYPELAGGDLLIVAGDHTATDSENEMALFDYWLHQQKYSAKIIIGGNHDNVLAQKRLKLQFATYLEDSGCCFNGFKVWGSPWSLWFNGIHPKCKAFTGSEKDLAKKFQLIPDNIDILITHSPAYGILDGVDMEDGTAYHFGSHALNSWLKYVGRPQLHVFGHIHEAHGKEEVFPTYNDKMMISVNASHVNENYQPVNKPIRIIL